MPEKRKTPALPEGRRKRPAPTIDLSATEVEVSGGPQPSVNEPGPNDKREAPVQEPPPDSPPPHEPEREQPPPFDDPPPSEEKPERMTSPPPPSDTSRSFAPALAAGFAGAALMAVLLGGLWYGGMFGAPNAGNAGDLRAQLAALQKQVQDLPNRPAAVADTGAVDALAQRVGGIESALANLPKGDNALAERLAAAENAMKSLGVALTALSQRSDEAAANAVRAREQAEDAASAVAQLRGSVQEAAKDASAAATPAQIETLQQRVAALEETIKTARDAIAKTAHDDTATRLALSAAALRNAAVGGAPYSAELAQAKALGADDTRLAPLAPFADSGVPSTQTLAQELRALIPAMEQAAGAQAPQAGFLERLQANASKLVRVQPIDAPPGDDPAAVLARIEVAAARGDIAAALADIEKLPEAARAPAQGWIAKAKARQAALAAANTLAADTARALGSR